MLDNPVVLPPRFVFFLSKSALVHSGLAAWMGARFRVVCAGHSRTEYLAFAKTLPVDVLVIDALVANEFLRSLPPELKPWRTIVIAAGSAPGERSLNPARSACAWLPYDAESPALERVVSAVVECSHRRESRLCQGCALPSTLKPAALPLSRREFAIFERIGGGMGTTAIAKALGISTKTVESLRERIKQKLRLRNGWELTGAAMAWRGGLLDLARETHILVSHNSRSTKLDKKH